MRFLERFQTVFLIAGIGFFLVSFIGMGVAPWTTLKDLRPPAGFTPRTELEELGRQVFIEEGCWHCHTQFVRPVSNEPIRWGPTSEASEYVYDIPQLFGTRRIGPDLAREAGRRTDDWHYAHFYNPRATVPWSVMPAYPWLFEEKDGKIVPTERAKALVAYMQSLGRDKLPIIQEQDSIYRANFRVGKAPQKTPELVERGRALFQRECSGCHGPKGDGEGLAKPFLVPPAQNLTEVQPLPEYTYTVLHLGMPGTSMPHFRDYPEHDLWALAFFVETLYREPLKPPTAPEKTPELLAKGRQLYGTLCASCHGPEGRGDGPAGKALIPPPANLRGLRPSALHVFKTLQAGIPGTAMASYAHLPEEDRWALAYYVNELALGFPSLARAEVQAAFAEVPVPPLPQAAVAPVAAPSATPQPPAPAVTAPEPTPELLALGKKQYEQVCFTCHGINGDGRGPASAALQPPPANFTDQEWKHGSRMEDIFRVITEGVPGTAMTSYQALPEKVRWGLAYYVKSFSDPKLREMVR